MRTAILIAIFAIITIVVALLPANAVDPFDQSVKVSTASFASR